MAITIGQQLGSYEITALLGKGGMGEVYRARDTKLKRDVAIKILPDEFSRDPARVSRFQREAEVLASLNHPNIAAIYDLQQASETSFLVLELVEGETLAERIQRGSIRVEEALETSKHICGALEAAHDKGIVHRDLKPANVKIAPDGRVKVLDFGLAKAMETAPASGTLSNSPTLTIGATQAGVILGTAAYMSPEQAKGFEVDARSDTFSFGSVLYEMLTGRPAFQGDTVAEVLASVLVREPDFGLLPPNLNPRLAELLQRCLQKNPKRRWQAAGDLRAEIETIAAAPRENSQIGAPKPIVSTTHLLTIIVTAIVFAVIGGFTVSKLNRPRPFERTLRYTIAPPENSRVHSFAISPDGQYLALAAAVSGKRQLWLRPMDGLQFQPMPDTDDAQLPFWSPDTSYIGFFAQGKLKRISLSGGPAQSLCNAGIGTGATWNREDVIMFSGADGSLQRIQAAGGVPSDARKPKEAGAYSYPAFLPDGRHFLYMLGFTSPETDGIYLNSLDGGQNQRILPDVSSVLFAPSSIDNRTGHLLFTRQSTLMAQPFDATSGQFLGDVFPVAEGIFTLTGNSLMAASVSETGMLVYVSSGTSYSSNLVWYDRTGKVLGLVAAPGIVFTPAISPDERSIAYARQGGGGADIWLRDLSRGIETRFTADPSGNYAPIWSPTGDRIVWVSNRRGVLNLYQKSTKGSGQDEPLLGPTAAALPVTANRGPDQWSRDGRFIVYSETTANRKRDLWVLQVGSADRKPVPFLNTQFDELHGQLSPDSSWIAYASDETGQREVYIRPFPAGDGVWRISASGGDQPRWRGDGKELFYVAADGRMMAVPIRAVTGPKPLFEPGTPVALFDSQIIATPQTSGVFQYDVTSDGKRFLVVTNNAAATARLTVVLNWNAGLKK